MKRKDCRTISLIGDVQRFTEDGTIPTEEDALDAKRMTDREIDQACKPMRRRARTQARPEATL